MFDEDDLDLKMSADINMTPMIDVLLCLLIIFLVASPPPPSEQQPVAIPDDPITEQPDDPEAIYARFSKSLAARNQSQPVSQRSVGCVWQNPPGDAAGRLVEAAGCKDLRVNGVAVSEKHANYFVNDDTGTADDFLALMAQVRSRVKREFQVELRPEVKFWGPARSWPS